MSGEQALSEIQFPAISERDWKAREILSHELPDYERLQRVTKGNMQETYEFSFDDEDYILQFSSSKGEELENGINVLRALQDSGVPVPELIEYDLQEPYIITDKNDGVSSRMLLKSKDEEGKKQLAQDIGSELRAVHEELDPNYYGTFQGENVSRPKGGDWQDYILGETKEVIDDLVSEYPEHRDTLESVVEKNRQTIPRYPEPALIHNDFIPANILVDDNGDATIIDWDMAFIGDPLLDLSGAVESMRVFTDNYEDEIDEAFLEGYGGDKEPETMVNYRMLTRAGMMHAATFQEDNNSGGFREPETHLDRISELLDRN